ncbi:MAG: DUF11 domain-containing protein [Chloroflexi bacterium]|nr:DUF11 domain-containing protein [Chloroflexota bacterium]
MRKSIHAQVKSVAAAVRIGLMAGLIVGVLVTVSWAGAGNADIIPQSADISAEKSYILADDADQSNAASPGDTLTYMVVIKNTGNMDATNVQFDDTIDPHTTLTGVVHVSPIAFDDTYESLGHVGIDVPAVSGLLANDVDPDNFMSLEVSAFDGISTGGGAVSVDPDGSFTYIPAPTFQGLDTFNYILTDNDSLTPNSQATVTIAVDEIIWFIDNTAAGGGDGTLISPFNSIAGFNTNAAAGPNDIIFIAEGDGSSTNYDAGITLFGLQQLIGQGVDLATASGLSVPSFSLPLPGASGPPTLVSNGGDGITLGADNVIRGLTIDDTTGAGIAGSFSTLVVRDVTISGEGQALNLSNGTLDVTFDDIASNNSATHGIDISSVSGSFTVSGATTITQAGGAGIAISGNSSAGFNFTEIDIDGTGAAGIDIDGGVGDFDVATSTSIDDTNLSGIEITNSSNDTFTFGDTTIGQSTPAGRHGIDISSNNTGASFSFSDLDITNSNGSGLLTDNSGTVNATSIPSIDSTGGAAIDVTNTIGNVGGAGQWTFSDVSSLSSSTSGVAFNKISQNINLTDINIAAPTGDGMRFDTILADIAIATGSIGGSHTDNHGIHLNGVAGSTTVQGTSAANRFQITDIGTVNNVAGHSGIHVVNSGDLTVNFLEIDDVGDNSDEHGINVEDPLPGDRSISISNSLFANIGDTGINGAGNAIDVEVDTLGMANGTYSYTGELTLILTDNDIKGNGSNFSTTHTAINVEFEAPANGTVMATVSDNDIDGVREGIAFLIEGDAGSGTSGRNIILMDSNTIDDLDNNAIEVDTLQDGAGNNDGNSRVVISNNTLNAITNYTGAGHDPDEAIEVEMRGDGGSPTLSVDITNNTIDSASNTAGERWDGNGITVGLAGASPTLTGSLSADISGNTTIDNVEDAGILLMADEAATFNVRVTNNTLGTTGDGIQFDQENDPYTFRVFFQNNDPGSGGWDIEDNSHAGSTFELGCTDLNNGGVCDTNIGNTLTTPGDTGTIISILAADGNTTAGFSIDNGASIDVVNQATIPGATLVSANSAGPDENDFSPFNRSNLNTSFAPNRITASILNTGLRQSPVSAITDLKPVGRGERLEARGRPSVPRSLTSGLAPASGESIDVFIGTLPPDRSVTIIFDVTIDNPPPVVTQVCNQGTVTADGAISVDTDDPSVNLTATDPTCTEVEAGTLPCLKYDLNIDGIIDIDDVMIAINASIFVLPYPGDLTYDLNDDNVVDIADIFAVAVHFGESCPQAPAASL